MSRSKDYDFFVKAWYFTVSKYYKVYFFPLVLCKRFTLHLSYTQYPELQIPNKSLLRRTDLTLYEKGRVNFYKKVMKTDNNCICHNNNKVTAIFLEISPSQCTVRKTTHLR